MATLQLIMFWPATGFPDRPWLEHPDEDAFVRSARSVCELYGEAVREAAVPNRHSELRLFCQHDGSREDVLVTVHPDVREEFESAMVELPTGIADMTAPARSRLVLAAVHAAATRLGQDRGWDRAALEAAREHVLAAGLRYRWKGPAKVSPDRRHTAHPDYVLHDDGYGRVTVRIRRRDDGEVVATSAPALAFSTSAGFARSARSLRWRSRTVVELIPYAGLSAGTAGTVVWRDNRGLVTVDLERSGTTGRPPGEPPDRPTTAEVVPRVVVQTPADAGPRIDVVGGGPMDDVPDVYVSAMLGLLDQLSGPAWQSWWSAAGVPVLEIWYDFAADDAGPRLRLSNGTLRTKVRRPASSFAATHDLARLAREDVETVLAAVRRRTGLDPHPALT